MASRTTAEGIRAMSDLEIFRFELKPGAGLYRLVDLEHGYGSLVANLAGTVEFGLASNRPKEIFQVRLMVFLPHLHGYAITRWRRSFAHIQYGRRLGGLEILRGCEQQTVFDEGLPVWRVGGGPGAGTPARGLRDFESGLVAHKDLVVSAKAVGGESLIERANNAVRRRVIIDRHHLVVPFVRRFAEVIGAAAGRDPFRPGIQEPIVNIDLVRTQIHNRSAAQSTIPAPVEKLLHRTESVFLKDLRLDGVPLGDCRKIALGAIPLAVDGRHPPQQFGFVDQLLITTHVPGSAG